MSTRLSFFEIPKLRDIGLKLFDHGIQGERFTARTSSGFIVDRKSVRRIEGRYIQRIASEDVFVDPLGKTHRQDTVIYVEQKFILRDEQPQMIVFNANSALRSLTGRLSEFSDFRLTLKSVEWSPDTLLSALAKRVPTVRVYAAKVNDIRLSAAVEGRLVCEGTTADVRTDIRTFLRRDAVVFDSVKVEFEHARSLRRCEIKADGVIQIYGDHDPAITDLWIKLISALPPRSSEPNEAKDQA